MKLGSRGSALALAQVELVKAALLRAHPGVEIEVKIITTSGDRRQEAGAGEGSAAGLKGLFTKEIQDALLAGAIDAAVHSLKDLPGITPPELGLAAVLPRADTSDILISTRYAGLHALPPGARVGTGSVRRRCQLQWLRPDLEVIDLRGNVPTRLQKLVTQNLDAIVLAGAGLGRLGYTVSADRLDCGASSFHAVALDILPAIGQGAIALETRRSDTAANTLLAALDHPPTHTCIRAERELLRLIDGDCTLPIAARAYPVGPDQIRLDVIMFGDDLAAAPADLSCEGPISAPEAVARALFDQLRK